jgi:segregation and condensation protein A
MTPPNSPVSLPCVESEEFEGPLDLLLDEVRRQNVAIERIALAPVAARFLEYVRAAARRDLNLDIEWLHMAATLIQWKSRSLLPSEVCGEAQDDPIRDDLVRRLLAHTREVAEELGRRRSTEADRFPRTADTGFREKAAMEEPEGDTFLSVWDMIRQARDIAVWVGQHRVAQASVREAISVEPDEVRVAEMIDWLRTEVGSAPGASLDALQLLRSQPTAAHRSCLFLGMLEMARAREFELAQNEIFGPICLVVLHS